MSASIQAPVSEKPTSFRRGLAATIGKNTIFGVTASLAQIGTRLVTVPIVIVHLGVDGYGIWAIIMTLAAYMRFGSIGIKSAFQKYVAEATGSGDFSKVNRLLSTGSFGMLAISLVGFIPIPFFSRQLAHLAGIPDRFLSSSASAIVVLGAIMLFSNFGSVYEAIVMGGHRIDLSRKFVTFFTVLEAIAIVIVLHYGYGLFAMATIMAVSELCYLGCCYVAAKRILPVINVSLKHLSRSTLRELVTFAGSYQLVNILEIVYQSILPVAILRVFGANVGGLLAVANRLVAAALMVQDALILPILSGGSMVYGTGSAENMRILLTKTLKVSLLLCLLPLAFVSAFGGIIIFAWTGQRDPMLTTAVWMISLAALFKALSLVELVLYRVSGKSLLDNIRQGMRIGMILIVSVLAPQLGVYGVLMGLAVVELISMVFMFVVLTRTFEGFTAKLILPDGAKLVLATAATVAVGIAATYIEPSWVVNERILSVVKLVIVSVVTLIAALPAFLLTRSFSNSEVRAAIDAFKRRTLKTAG
jgi:O-antigen/teichoic acid export membrane protein